MLAPGWRWRVARLGGVLLRRRSSRAAAAVAGALGPLVATHGMLPLGWWPWRRRWRPGSRGGSTPRTSRRRRGCGRARGCCPATPPHPISCRRARARDLAGAINGLAAPAAGAQADMARLVEEASANVAHERDQLGALMAELNQSVVVCNLEGRILLYNAQRAAALPPAVAGAGGAGGAELIGLGRSIHGVIDRALIAHALETVERRIARGDGAASARFVTGTPAGHLLRVSLAPVRPSRGEARRRPASCCCSTTSPTSTRRSHAATTS